MNEDAREPAWPQLKGPRVACGPQFETPGLKDPWCWQLAYATASSAQVIATRRERVVIGRSKDWLDAYLWIGALPPTAGECSYLFIWCFHLFWRFHHQRQQ